MVESVEVLTNTGDLLGSCGGIIKYDNYPMIRYRRKVMFSMEDLLGKWHIGSVLRLLNAGAKRAYNFIRLATKYSGEK